MKIFNNYYSLSIIKYYLNTKQTAKFFEYINSERRYISSYDELYAKAYLTQAFLVSNDIDEVEQRLKEFDEDNYPSKTNYPNKVKEQYLYYITKLALYIKKNEYSAFYRKAMDGDGFGNGANSPEEFEKIAYDAYNLVYPSSVGFREWLNKNFTEVKSEH